MKKLLCLILSVILAMSCLIGTGVTTSAQSFETENGSDQMIRTVFDGWKQIYLNQELALLFST